MTTTVQPKKTIISATVHACCYSLLLSHFGFVSIVQAGPIGGDVVGGSGAITQSGVNTTINQTSQNMAIDWQSYNVNANERVQYIQPNVSSVSLNRILSNSGSTIAGRIDANGQVILVNPNGVFFTATAVLNVGGIIASGLDIKPTDFMNSNYIFNEVLGTEGAVINSGIINASLGGNVALIGRKVENNGLISAHLGTVTLAAGKQAVLTFDNDGLLGVRVSQEILQSELGVDPAVVNSGDIQAQGGRVLLTASTSQDVFSRAVNTTGIEQATSVVVHDDGSFTLGGGADVVNSGTINTSTTASDQNVGRIILVGENVTSSGTLKADAANGNGGEIELHARDMAVLTQNSVTSARSESNGTGGMVKVLGDKVGLFDQATIDVSGSNGGGRALIGGDFQGKNPFIPNASVTFIGRDANIMANAADYGHGGKIIIWSDINTYFLGSVYTRGGAVSGNGGFVEISGKDYLLFDGTADRTAVNGVSGTLLLDPQDIRIRDDDSDIDTLNNDFLSLGSANPTIVFATSPTTDIEISNARIVSALVNGPVELQATRDIYMDSDAAIITATGNTNSLTFLAGDDISIDAGINIGQGMLRLVAGTNSGVSGCGIVFCADDNNTGAPLLGRNISITSTINTTGAIILHAADNIYINGAIGGTRAPSSLTVRAGDSISSNSSGSITMAAAGGNVDFTAADASLQLATETYRTRAPRVTTPNGDISIAGDITTNGGDFTATTTNGYFDNWFTGQSISVGSGAVDITANGSGTVAKGVNITAGAFLGNITTGAGSSVTVTTTTGQIIQSSTDTLLNLAIGGDAIFNAGTNAINLQNPANAIVGTIRLGPTAGAGGNVTLNNVSPTTALVAVRAAILTVNASRHLTLFGNVTTTGSADLNFGSAAGSTFTASPNITLTTGAALTVDGGGNADTFTISSLFTGQVRGNGGADTLGGPDAAINNQNNWRVTSAGGGTLIQTGTNTPATGTVTFSGITHLTGGTGNDEFTMAPSGVVTDAGSIAGTIDGNGGVNTLIGRDAPNTWAITGSNTGNLRVTGSGSADIVNNFVDIQNLRGGTGNDSFTFAATGAISGIDGLGGTNTLTGRGTANTWSITTPNTGTVRVTGQSSYASFANIQTIEGGSLVDTFDLGATVGTVNGLAGNDVFNINANVGTVNGGANDDTFNIATGVTTANLVGGTGINTVRGPNAINTWTVTNNTGGGNLNTTILFSQMATLTGGTGAAVDTFDVNNGASIGTLNGGDGNDIFRINAGGNVTTALNGGTGADDITVNGTVAALNAGAGADIINIGSTGSVTGLLDGGSESDSLTLAWTVDTVVNLNAPVTGSVGLVYVANLERVTAVPTFTNTFTAPTTGTSIKNWTITDVDVSGMTSNEGTYTDTGTGTSVVFINFNTLNGGNGGDNFYLPVAGAITGTINGNGNLAGTNDSLSIAGGDNTWSISTSVPTSGSVYVTPISPAPPTQVTTFTGIEIRNGGSGIDVADLSGFGMATIDLANYSGFELIIGSGSGTLQSLINNTWYVGIIPGLAATVGTATNNGSNDGIVNGTQFLDFPNLLGGSGTDTFRFDVIPDNTNALIASNNGIITGYIDGGAGAGINTLVGRDLANTWSINNVNTPYTPTNTVVAVVNGVTYVNDFRNMTRLTGSTNFDDNFNFSVDANIQVDGGSGAGTFDTVNLSTVSTALNKTLGATGYDNVERIIGNTNSLSTLTGTGGLTWVISDVDDVAIVSDGVNDGTADGVQFINFANLTGGAGNDTFTFTAASSTVAGGSITGTINGGGGFDTVDRSALVNDTVDLSTASYVAIDRFIGNNTTSTLQGPDTPNVWVIGAVDASVVPVTVGTNNGVNDGTINSIQFIDFNSLVGGNNDDVFRFATGGSVTAINGGGQLNFDLLDYSSLGSVTVIASSLIGFIGLEGIRGGANSTLQAVTNSTSNTWAVYDLDGAGSLSDGVNDIAFSDNSGTPIFFIDFQNLIGGTGIDTFDFSNASNTATVGLITGLINGNGGADILTGKAIANTFSINNLGSIASAGGTTYATFNGIQTLNGGGAGDTITVNSGATITEINALAGNDVITVNGTVTRIAAGDNDDVVSVGVSGVVSGVIDGGNGTGDTLDITALLGDTIVELGNRTTANLNVYQVERIDANLSPTVNNTLIADNTNNTGANSWNINGPNSGTVAGTVFSGFSHLMGGSLNDDFTLAPGGSVSGLINGILGGTDTLTITAGGDQIVEIGNRVNTNLNIFALESVTGNPGTSNTLIGDNIDNQNWTISSPNEGNVGATAFSNFRNLRGGSLRDQFTLNGLGSLSGLINGEGDSDTLTVAVSGITIEIGNRDTGNLNVFQVETINSTGSNNTLLGDNTVDYTWNVSTNSSIVATGGVGTPINFSGFSTLQGNSSIDTFNVSVSINQIDAGDNNDIVNLSSGTINTLNLGAGNDRLTMTGSAVAPVVDAGTGDDTITIRNTISNTTMNGGEGNDIFIIGDTSGNGDATNVTLNGGNGDDQFLIFRANYTSLRLNGEGGVNDSLGNSTLGAPLALGASVGGVSSSNIESVGGNFGQLNAQPGLNITWTITGTNSGIAQWTDAGVANTVNFNGFSTLNGSNPNAGNIGGVDIFNLRNQGQITSAGGVGGVINGNGGNDVLDISLTGTPAGEVNFNGGVGTNSVTIGGNAPYESALYTPLATNGFDQIVYYNATNGTYRVGYQSVNTVTTNLAVATLQVNGTPTGGADTILLNSGNTFRVNAQTLVTYNGVTNLTVNGGAGADTITVNAVNLLGTGTLSLIAETITDDAAATGATITAGTLLLDTDLQTLATNAGSAMNPLSTNITNLQLGTATQPFAGSSYIDDLDTNGLNLGYVNTSGITDIRAAGAINNSDTLISSNVFSARTTGNITLNGALSGALAFAGTANNVSLNNTAATSLAGVSAQALTITSTGDITDSGVINVTGVTDLTSSGNIILDNANNFGGRVDVDAAVNVTLNDVDSIGVGRINASNRVSLTAANQITGMNVGDASVFANELVLRAVNGITFGDSATVGTEVALLDAINTNTVSNVPGVIINNRGALTVANLQNRGNVFLYNDTSITVDPTNQGALPRGAISANYGGALSDTTYAGDVDIRISGVGSISATGSVDVTAPDIIAEDLIVLAPSGTFGAPGRLMHLSVNGTFFLSAIPPGYVIYYGGRRPIETGPTSLVVFSDLAGISGQQLVAVESLAEVDQAIFTEVRNYFYEDLAIKMPPDQLYGEDDEKEKKRHLNKEETVQ